MSHQARAWQDPSSEMVDFTLGDLGAALTDLTNARLVCVWQKSPARGTGVARPRSQAPDNDSPLLMSLWSIIDAGDDPDGQL
jgi:hypothetical protein